MLSYIDPIIFPDDCEVLELSADRFIYPIYKNGSSTLHTLNLKKVKDISKLKVIDVLIRNPYERFYSGVSTYLKNLDSSLDKKTALFFVSQYLFLNRHYCPQFHWLVNLRRHTDAKIRLLPITELSNITQININKNIVDDSLYSQFDDKLDFYLQLDKVLHEDLMNHVVNFSDIIEILRDRYNAVYLEVVQRSQHICSVLD